MNLARDLAASGTPSDLTKFRRHSQIFSQGEKAEHVCFLRDGAVKLSVSSRTGKEAVVAILAPGDFFGESVLAGHTVRIVTATAMSACTVITITRDAMARLLHNDSSFSDSFIRHMLTRNIRVEADLVDQLFNSSERRLARALLLLSRYGESHPQTLLPHVSQETLAEMIGSTRARVNFFMNKFRRLGFIEYNGRITVRSGLLDVVLHDDK